MPSGDPGTALHAQLPFEATSARVARQLVAGLLVDHGYGNGLVEDSELVAYELVLNAALHGAPDRSGTIGFECGLGSGLVNISVHDGGSSGSVAPQPPSEERASGRGLAMVHALAESWSVDRSSGTRVTALLAAWR